MQFRLTKISQTVRAFEWWEYKLSPLFATIYATAYLLHTPILTLWPLLLLAFAALVPGAAYVSVLNDLTDRREDIASGKPNRLVGKSRFFIALVLTGCILPGLIIALYWRKDSLLLFLYLAAWVVFSLYSLPPIRLKRRGLLGIVADASGAHLFPTLLVLSLVFRWTGKLVDPIWFVSVATWSLCNGLRGILWHQISDSHNDEKIGLNTFAVRHKVSQLQTLARLVIFPAELAGFTIMLCYAQSFFAFGFLGGYLILALFRRRRWGLKSKFPRSKSRIS